MRVLLPKKFIEELNKVKTYPSLIKAIEIIFSTPTYYNNNDIYKALVSKIKSLEIQNNHYCSYGVIHSVFDYLFKPDRDNPDKSFELFELLVGLSAENNYNSNQFIIIPDTKDKNTQINLCIYIYFDLDEMLNDEEFMLNHHNTITLIKNNWYPFLVYICKYYDINYTKTLASICKSLNIVKTIRAINNSSFSEFKKSIDCPLDNPEDITAVKQLFSKLSLLLQYNDEKKKFVKSVALTTLRNEKIMTFIKETVNDLCKDNTSITEEKIEMMLFTAIEYFSKIDFSKIIDIESNIPFMYALKHYIMLCKSITDANIDPMILSMVYQTISFIIDIDSQMLSDETKFKSSLREVIHKIIKELDFSSDNVFIVSESMIDNYLIRDPKIALEEYTKETSANIQRTQNRIYGAYKNFKRNEGKIEAQADKALVGLKNMLFGNKRKEIIEGREFSPMRLFKKLIGGLAIFSISPILGAITLITKKALDKRTTMRERYKILQELETEVVLLDEKIADAKSAGDNKAKYILMRQRSELERAVKRIRYGLPADQGSTTTLKEVINDNDERNEI